MDRARIEEIFNAALSQDTSAARAAYLDQACAGDAPLRERIEKLLAAHEAAGGFLGLPESHETVEMASPLREGPGSRIGRYKLLEQIGEGGFGVVFMAEQEQPIRRRVALKIIKLGMDTKQVVARFEAERQALAMMDHPSIAKVFDAGTTETGRPYFVMELVNGIPLTRYCDENRLSARERLDLFIPICQAVQHAHQKGVIHRDLKPTNVLVTLRDGKPIPKVIDFGIAKATQARLTEKTLFTEFRQMIGTPQYMSPEQAEMNEIGVDTRSDIYSLGVLLYELLTGTTPIESHDLYSKAFGEMQRIIREVDPPAPSRRLSTMGQKATTVTAQRRTDVRQLSRFIRGDLDWVVMKCLEKDRTRRYESASSLAGDIQRYLASEPVSAAKPSALYRARKFIRRNKGPVTAAAAILLALVLGLVTATGGFIQARAQKKVAQGRFNDVRTLANKFMLDFHAKVENLPGSTPAVKMLVETSLEYLNRLAAEAKDDPELLKDLAVAYEKIGDIQGLPRKRNLGDLTGAMTSYRSSYDITTRLLALTPADFPLQLQLLGLRASIGDVQQAAGGREDALKTFEGALADAQRIASGHPGDREARRMVGLFHQRIASALMTRGKIKECLEHYDASREIYSKMAAESPDDVETQRSLGVSDLDIGNVLWKHGDPSHPMTTGRPLFRTEHSQGNLNGDPASALVSFYRALETFQKLSAAEPLNIKAQQDLAKAQRMLASVLLDCNDAAGALDMLSKALRVIEAQADADKINVQLQMELASIYHELGSIRDEMQDSAGALSAFRRYREIARRVLDVDRTNQSALTHLADSDTHEGALLRHIGDLEGALKWYLKAQEDYQRVVDQDPQNLSLLQWLAYVYAKQAAILQEASDLPRAVAAYEKCLPLCAKVANADVTNKNVNWNYAIWAREAGYLLRKMAADEARPASERAALLKRAREKYDEAARQFERMRNLGIVDPQNGWGNEIRGELRQCDKVEAAIAAPATRPAIASTSPTTHPAADDTKITEAQLNEMNLRAVALVEQKQIAEALALRRKLVESAALLPGRDNNSDPKLVRYRVSLAELLIQSRNFTEAEGQLLSARLDAERPNFPPQLSQLVLAKMTELYQAWGSYQSLAAAGDEPPVAQSIKSLDVQVQLAQQLGRNNRLPEAAALAAQVLASARRNLLTEEPAIARYELAYAEALLALRKYPEAEAHLLEAKKRAESQNDTASQTKIVRALLTLYADWVEAPRSAQREAIAAQAATLRGQILRPQHTKKAENWNLDLNSTGKASLLQDGESVLATVNAVGKEPWMVQITQAGLDLEEGRRYTLSFGARADVERTIAATATLDEPDWRHIGLNSKVELGPAWRNFEYSFTARGVHKQHNRIVMVLGASTGPVWIRNLSLVESADQQERAVVAALPAPPRLSPQELELEELNRSAWFLRRDNHLEEAKKVRGEVVQKAINAFSAADPRTVKYVDDYVLLLVQMKQYEEAEKALNQSLAAVRTRQDRTQELKLLRRLAQVFKQWEKPEKESECLTLIERLLPATRPATLPGFATTRPAAIAVDNSKAVTKAMGQQATVEGVVNTAFWSATGRVMNIEFVGVQSDGFYAAMFSTQREQMDAAFGGNFGATLAGARVQISGTITSYRDRPQIIISEPEQIRVIAPSTRPATRPASRPAR